MDSVDLLYGTGSRRSGGPSTLALSGASLSVAQDEFVAIVGPSGCGKSSLLKLISGLLQPTRGVVRVDGKVVRKPLKAVGMAFQSSTLLPWRNIRDNVLLPLEIVEPYRRQGRSKLAHRQESAEELLAAVGLAGFGNRMPWQLSGGMQQRAQLCRALIHEPAILLLDEPFGALDAFTREELWDVLQRLWMGRKCAVILVTHELREAAFLADTVHVMSSRPGQVVVSNKVNFGRPRTLETTFEADFVELVHNCRQHIRSGRAA